MKSEEKKSEKKIKNLRKSSYRLVLFNKMYEKIGNLARKILNLVGESVRWKMLWGGVRDLGLWILILTRCLVVGWVLGRGHS